jgi:hypothetical protein
VNRVDAVRLQNALLLVALLMAFAVLMFGVVNRDMRDDEGIAFDGTSGTILTTIQYQQRDIHAPLWFVSFNLWQKVAGDSEFAGRVFSLLQSMLTLALVYRIGERWLGGRWAGLCALVALALSSYFFVYGLEIRPYAMIMLVSALSMTFFFRWLETRTWRDALLWGLTVMLMLYLHYLGVFLFVMQGMYFFAQSRRTFPRLWGQAVVALGMALLIWLPWFPTFFAQFRHIGGMVQPGDTRIPGVGVAVMAIPTTTQSVAKFADLATNEQPLLYALILLAGLALLWRKRRYWLAVAWGIGLPAFTFLVNLIVPVYEPRYATPLVPGFGLVVGVSLAALPGRWTKGAALGVFAVLALLTVQTGVTDRPPLRSYLRQLDAAFQPGEVVYLDGIYLDLVGNYQYRHYAPSVMDHLVSPQPKNDFVGAVDDNATLPRCVWFVTKDWFDPTVRAHFDSLVATRPLQRVIGDQRYLFQQLCAPPEVEPRLFGDSLRFRGADIESVTRDQVTLKLWWDVLKAPGYDYSISVQLLDPAGKLVTQSDGPIIDYWGRGPIQTSTLVPGDIYIHHPTLTVPPGTPPGQYRLALTVYQSWDGMRLPVAGATDNLLLFDSLTLP